MAHFLIPNEGKVAILRGFQMAEATVYAFLSHGKTISGADIDVSTTLATIGEITGTGYARIPLVLPDCDEFGIIAVPGSDAVWQPAPGVMNWNNNVMAWGIASGLSTGVCLGVQDIPTDQTPAYPVDMSNENARLELPNFDWFFKNVFE